MAWKKIIHSGSDAHLNHLGIGVADPTTMPVGTLSASKTVIVSTADGGTNGDLDQIMVYNTSTKEFNHIPSSEIVTTMGTLTLANSIGGTTYDGGTERTMVLNTASLAGNGLTNTGVAGKISASAHLNIGVSAQGIAMSQGIADTNRGLEFASNKLGLKVDDSTIEIVGDELDPDYGKIKRKTTVSQFDGNLTQGGNIAEFTYSGSLTKAIAVTTSTLDGTGLVDNGNALDLNTSSLSDNQTVAFGTQFTGKNLTQDGNAITLGTTAIHGEIPGELVVNGTTTFAHENSVSIADKFIFINSGSSSSPSSQFGYIGQDGATAKGWSYSGGTDTTSNRRFGFTTAVGNLPAGELGTFQGSQILVTATGIAAAAADSYDLDANGKPYGKKKGNLLIDDAEAIYVYVG